jgi:hypothetical protein
VVPAFVDNTAVGTTAAYTDGNAVLAVAGSTPLAAIVFILCNGNNGKGENVICLIYQSKEFRRW